MLWVSYFVAGFAVGVMLTVVVAMYLIWRDP